MEALTLTQEDGGEENAEDWIQESVNGNLGNVVVFQQDGPECVGTGGNEYLVNEDGDGLAGPWIEMAAGEEADGDDDQATEEELPATQHNRVGISGKNLCEYRGEGIGKC